VGEREKREQLLFAWMQARAVLSFSGGEPNR
jgi:hypothetical protein